MGLRSRFVLAEVDALQPCRQSWLFRWGLKHHCTARERIDTIGNGQRLLNQLLDEEDGGARIPQLRGRG
jgi:hypothetical protein